MRGSEGSISVQDSSSRSPRFPEPSVALAVGIVPRCVFNGIVAVLLALLAFWPLVGERLRVRRTPRGRLVARELVDSDVRTYRYAVPVRRGTAYSSGVGFLSSLLGMGGGGIHVSVLVGALGFPTHIATATSHFVVAIMAAWAVATHALTEASRPGHGLRRATACRSESWLALISARVPRSGSSPGGSTASW